MYSSGTNGSLSESFFKENSTIGLGKAVPSEIANRFVKEPAAKFLTIISSGIISTSLISCSLIFRRFRKCVGIPI